MPGYIRGRRQLRETISRPASAGMLAATTGGLAYASGALKYLYNNRMIPWNVYKTISNLGTIAQSKAVSKLLRKNKVDFSAKKSTTIASISKKLRKIQRHVNNEQATHTHRRLDISQLIAPAYVVTYGDYDKGNLTSLHLACAALRYYNPGTNALVTNDAGAGTYNNEVLITVSRKLVIRNNYQVPANIQVYSQTPKVDTSIAPYQACVNGLADQGGVAITSPLVYYSDSEENKAYWYSKKLKDMIIQPGQQVMVSHQTKEFPFDFSNADTHALQYQKKLGAHVFTVRLQGVFGHDSVAAAEVATLSAGLDIAQYVTYKIVYDAGKSLSDFSISNNQSTFTNGGLVSNKPVSDNQAYSVA